jgi:cell division transport system permease protein
MLNNVLPNEAGTQLGVLFGSFSLGLDGVLAIGILVPIIAGLTAITSRLTVKSFLRKPS